MSIVIDPKTEASVVETSISVVLQTLFYGIYAVLAASLTNTLLQRKPKSLQIMQYALGLTAFMFALSTAFWGVIVAHLVDIIHQLSGDPVAGGFNITDANDLMNALVLINTLAIAEGVVVWRAWEQWKVKNRIAVKIALLFWILAIVAVIATIIIRIALLANAVDGRGKPHNLVNAINIAQVGGLAFAVLANATSSLIIFIQISKAKRSGVTHVKGVLALLVETGVLYFVALIIGLIALFVHLPGETLGDVYQPILTQLAGVHTTLVFLFNNEGGEKRNLVVSHSGDDLNAYAEDTRAYRDDA